ncbi:MAG: helicase HerA domain-containing protein [[Clostridium] symbiosum]
MQEPISIDISPLVNSHMLICGMSGSGKSFCENILLRSLHLLIPKTKYILLIISKMIPFHICGAVSVTTLTSNL